MVRRAHNEAGMTLLELMFAAGILAMGLSLLFGSLISINLMGDVAENRTVASAQLSSILESVRSSTLRQLASYVPPELTAPGVQRRIQLECYDANGNAIALPLADASNIPALPNPLEVKATLIWSDKQGRVYSRSASTRCGR